MGRLAIMQAGNSGTTGKMHSFFILWIEEARSLPFIPPPPALSGVEGGREDTLDRSLAATFPDFLENLKNDEFYKRTAATRGPLLRRL